MSYEELTNREIDALVWEKIACPQRAKLGRSAAVVWEPTQDVGQAFEVVEAMRERGYLTEMYQKFTGRWDVEFMGANDAGASHVDKSLPRAICLAALRALDD